MISDRSDELTRLEVSKGSRGASPGWHHQQIRRMLENSKYIGRWRWGATKTLRASQGKTRQLPVPRDQHVIRDRPDLRIIDQELWGRVQARLRELDAIYGLKKGQKPRGIKPHHSQLYPRSLLGGLLFCRSCGARLYVQTGGKTLYYGCPGHRKGLCSVATRVHAARAEEAILGLTSSILTDWPGWLEKAAQEVRLALKEQSDRVPLALKEDEHRLRTLESRIEKLIDAIADGGTEIGAIRRRLEQLEREAEGLRIRVDQGRDAGQMAMSLPEVVWIREQLKRTAELLRDDTEKTAWLLRHLFGKIESEAVVAPGKTRGFTRLLVRVNPAAVIREVLRGTLTDAVAREPSHGGSPLPVAEFQLELGSPTRYDLLAPEIAALREQGMIWKEIGRVTGVGTGNAQNIWSRWKKSQPA